MLTCAMEELIAQWESELVEKINQLSHEEKLSFIRCTGMLDVEREKQYPNFYQLIRKWEKQKEDGEIVEWVAEKCIGEMMEKIE